MHDMIAISSQAKVRGETASVYNTYVGAPREKVNHPTPPSPIEFQNIEKDVMNWTKQR